MNANRHIMAFSLVEVTIAIGVLSFVLISLVGILMVGIRTKGDSQNMVSASNLASLLISQRRAMPTNNVPASFLMTNFALPELRSSSANFTTAPFSAQPEYITCDGCVTNRQNAGYGLLYKVDIQSSAKIYLVLFWPAAADPSTSGASRYEINTQIALVH